MNLPDSSLTTLDIISTCLAELLGRPTLRVALRQRAKFEGWLKVELAHALETKGASVALEFGIQGTSYRADVRADFHEAGRVIMMLKTINTNFRFRSVMPRHRPITRNISGIIEDLTKLRSSTSPDARLAIFPIFPVAGQTTTRDAQLAPYLERIRLSGGTLERSGFVVPPSSAGDWGVAWFIVQVQPGDFAKIPENRRG